MIRSYVHSDKSIFKDAGIEGINVVEALPPPLEIKYKVPAQKTGGEISYFICTWSGRGLVLLPDKSLALLDLLTGCAQVSYRKGALLIYSHYIWFFFFLCLICVFSISLPDSFVALVGLVKR